MTFIYKIISKEPVALGKALSGTINLFVIASDLSDIVKAAITVAALAWIGWGERLLSTPTVTVEGKELAARNQALADVDSLVGK